MTRIYICKYYIQMTKGHRMLDIMGQTGWIDNYCARYIGKNNKVVFSTSITPERYEQIKECWAEKLLVEASK